MTPELSPLEKALSLMCHHCPVCGYGREHPESWLGKVLHHPLHAEHCPAWKAEKKAYGETAAEAATSKSGPAPSAGSGRP